MVENFRSRMGDLRQEMDRIAGQAEEMERIVQEQQVRLEEMDLLVRQRDEQLSEQQAHVEELESTLRQHKEDLTTLRAQLAEKEQSLAVRDQELDALRAQLSQHEETEAALREELAQLRQAPTAAAEPVPVQPLLERFAVLESLVNRQGESLFSLRAIIQEEMARLHSRLDQLEARLAAAPVSIPTPRVAEVAPPVEAAAPAALSPLAAPVTEAPPPAVALPDVALPVENAPAVLPTVEIEPPPIAPFALVEADSLQTVLQETMDMLPTAALVGLAGRDGLNVEMLVRREPAFAQPLELELADLTAKVSRVAAALNTGPLLTVAFQAGDEHLLLSPVGEDHFAYLLAPADSPGDIQQAQAVLLQTVSRINDLD